MANRVGYKLHSKAAPLDKYPVGTRVVVSTDDRRHNWTISVISLVKGLPLPRGTPTVLKHMKLLIGYDGSECADAAIEDLRFAGLPDDAEAVILTVTETWLPSNDPDEDPYSEITEEDIRWPWRDKALDRIAQCEKFALEAWKRLRGMFPQWNIRHEIASGFPEWAVVSKANKIQADLVVVGSEGRSNIGRFVLGSVALKVLSEAECSVRVARPSVRHKQDDGTPLRLLAGFDGSPDSQLAIEKITQRQWPSGTEVTLVTAVESPDHLHFEGETVEPEEMQRSGIEALKMAGLIVSSVNRTGRAKDVLLDEAAGMNADTIFMGATGHRFMERMLLGSVSYAVTARANCSVEVVRSNLVGSPGGV